MTDHQPDDDGPAAGTAARRADVTYELDEDERPSEAVVRAVASLTDTSVLDLHPLYDAIDPDDLDGLFAAAGRDAPPENVSVSFQFGGCTVTVTPDEVRVRERDGDAG